MVDLGTIFRVDFMGRALTSTKKIAGWRSHHRSIILLRTFFLKAGELRAYWSEVTVRAISKKRQRRAGGPLLIFAVLQAGELFG